MRKVRVAVKVVLCVLVGAVLFACALFANTAIGYVPAIAYVVALLLSFLYTRILKRGVACEINDGGGTCERGETSGFALTVRNDSFLPAVRIRVVFFLSDLFGGEGSVSNRVVALGPRQSKTYDFGMRFDHIGTYQVGVKRFEIMDLIGVFSVVHDYEELATMRVRPRLFDVSDLPLSTDSAIEAKKNFTTVLNEGMDYSSVREYQWGDPIKAIHWKLSSRLEQGEYLTRLYETNANPGLAIVADFDAPEYTIDELMGIYDTVVECSFSLERYADANSVDAELIFLDKTKAQRRFFTPLSTKRREILDCMPKIYSPGTGREALGLIESELKSAFAQYNLALCTSVISNELVESLMAARMGKRAILLFAVIPETVTREKRTELLKRLEPLASAGVYYRVISHATALGQEG